MEKRKSTLEAKIVYDEKIAKSFHKVDYFSAQVDYLRNIETVEQDKSKTTGIRDERVTQIREKYQELGMRTEIKIFRVLQNIKNKVINCLIQNQPVPKHDNLINIVAHPLVLLAAYRTIRPNKGAKSTAFPIPEAEFNKLSREQQNTYIMLFNLPDGLELEALCEISALIKSNSYPWGCSRLIWIPKPGTTKRRPITIPSFADRMVQEAIRMVLESIYEPVFMKMNCSFGFRASNGVHEAIVKATDPRLSSGLHMALEGDIESAYPNLDRQILLETLEERIIDKKLLKLIKQRLHLRLFDMEKKNYEQTLIGIPQGGSDSPYLWNIYLLGLDQFVTTDIQQYIDQLNEKRLSSKGYGQAGKIAKENPIYKPYNQLSKKLMAVGKQIKEVKSILKNKTDNKNDLKIIFNKIEEKRLLLSKKLKTRSTDPHRYKIKINYIRYADDWIILTNAPKHILLEIKTRITNWLLTKRKATLSQEKTLITDMRKEKAHFLGFEFKNSKARRIKETAQGLKRTTGWQVISSPDKQRLINRLFMKGYCQKDGFPKEMPWLSTFDAFIIIERFNSVITGLANFYAEFVKYPSSLNRWLYIVRYSCLKTLAQKYKTNIKGVFKIFGENVTARIKGKYQGIKLEKTVSLITEKQAIEKALKIDRYKKISKRLLRVDQGHIEDYQVKPIRGLPIEIKQKQLGRTPRIFDDDFLERIKWVNFRSQASLEMPCIFCGEAITEMHHLEHIRKLRYSKITDDFTKSMYVRNRKQAPVCRTCHANKLHTGKITLAKSLKEIVSEAYAERVTGADIIKEINFDVRAKILSKDKLNDTRAINPEAKISVNPDKYQPEKDFLIKLQNKGWKTI